ncbi:cytochrome b [Amphritea sp.]|uniref:cytochrome b n=1 Tax=Amphritea sp. TaxID=1872502 RepID=UPI0025C65D0E|nr:cytochrome b [Amphritea sp.]
MASPIKDNSSTFGLGSILLHWVIALTIIGMYPLGLYIDSLTYYDEAYNIVPAWHESIGIILLAFLAMRFLWRAINKAPAPLPQPKPVLLITKAVHLLLYLLPVITVASGYMITTADGRPISVFNWFEVPALPAISDNQEDLAGEVHFWVATFMISLAGLHALAALKHHYIDKDKTLTRMLSVQSEAKQ